MRYRSIRKSQLLQQGLKSRLLAQWVQERIRLQKILHNKWGTALNDAIDESHNLPPLSLPTPQVMGTEEVSDLADNPNGSVLMWASIPEGVYGDP